jgi:hypothetical protein
MILVATAQAIPNQGSQNRRRERVDRSSPLPGNAGSRDIYFTAVELNCTGIRFYGDVALFLSQDTARQRSERYVGVAR